VKGYWPYVPFLGKGVELGNELMGVTDWIDATVPGGVHKDLLNAGLIEDPYYEMNSLKCEWVENRWWMYRTIFTMDNSFIGKNLSLIFKGIDYKAHIYLNKEKLGTHENMFTPAEFDVTKKVKFGTDNELVVLLENVPSEMSQTGYTSQTKTQKSRFSYKWDFGTRMVNIGLWDDVLIRVTGKFRLDNTFVSGTVDQSLGIISVSTDIRGIPNEKCRVRVSVDYNDLNITCLEREILFKEDVFLLKEDLEISNPLLWYPNGTGEQPLYKVKIQVLCGDEESDQCEFYTGIRKLEYRKNEGSTEDSLPYTIVVNGKPVYIKGVNLVPFDLLYGNITREIYDYYVFLLKNANINLVRIWGGGLIEKEYFYHLCDVNGIMVWQEFIQSSSGIENVPSTDAKFLELLKSTAEHAVKTKRNHVCHTVWSGGNELRDEDGKPITYENLNIGMLKDIVEKYDPGKLFLPSSASGPNEFLDIEQLGKNHDVHGNWKYGGVEEHYRIFNRSDSLLHSEFGVDGCSSFQSLKKFLGEKNLVLTDVKNNLVWRHHGEWWDTLGRDIEIFGQFSSLEQFIKASQFIQAEGIRYALEANRRRKFKNSGSIVWQFNEPWPNAYCTSLVEYYGYPKMAYYWLRTAYSPVHASLSYDRLYYKPGDRFKGGIYAHNSLDATDVCIYYEILDAAGRAFEKDEIYIKIRADSAQLIKELQFTVPEFMRGVFFIRLKVTDFSGEVLSENLYIFTQQEKEVFAPLFNLRESRLNIRKEGEKYIAKNEGEVVCLFVHGVSHESVEFIIDNNYASIFPGEEKVFRVIRRDEANNPVKADLKIEWRHFNNG